MSCDCHETEAAHVADEAREKASYLPQYEAERRVGMAYHCPECIREARGDLAAEACRLCPPGRHQLCEAHR